MMWRKNTLNIVRMKYSKENYNLLQNRGMLQINNITTMSSTKNTTKDAYSVTNLLRVKQLKPWLLRMGEIQHEIGSLRED